MPRPPRKRGPYLISSKGERKRSNPAYSPWHNMKSRCNNPKASKYNLYGGAGITVCPEWDTFEGFLQDMGPRPEGTSLDRIDPTGNYEPSNCRWATTKQQRDNNRRYTKGGIYDLGKCQPKLPKPYQAIIAIDKLYYRKYFLTENEGREWLDNLVIEKGLVICHK